MSNSLLYSNSKELDFFFPAGLTAGARVSKESCFGDDTWNFYDASNPRLNAYTPAQLTIQWYRPASGMAYSPLPSSILIVLKLYAYLYLNAPAAVVHGRRRNSKNHPATVCHSFRTIIPFIVHLQKTNMLDGTGISGIWSLADVTVRHLRQSLSDWNFGSGLDLKIALVALTRSVIQQACPDTAPRWSASDINSMSFRLQRKRDDFDPVFPNPLFRLASNKATDEVVGFLRFVGVAPASNCRGLIPANFSLNEKNGEEIFRAYVSARERVTSRYRDNDNGIKGDGVAARKKKLKALKTTPGDVLEYIANTHDAACALISLYTGARYSDLNGFRKGCVQRIRGMWYLVGTHIKHQDIDKPSDTDLWPAIPAIRDAIRCLELFSEFTNNPYLISNLNTVCDGEGQGYSSGGLTDALARFFKRIDIEETWSHIKVSTHRCRNTLAHQLARSDLGLVFIAHQMKHLHSALRAVPPQVTLMYGKISDLKVERAMQGPVIHYELAKSLYDPDSPITGGGASEFVERRKRYFEGMQASGLTKEDILRNLSTRAIPFSSVGMGFCLGRLEIKNKDGSTQKPPCIGSLQCSPGSCPNALITETHVPLWKKVVIQNRELATRPDMKHAQTELIKIAEHASRILSQLGVKL